MDILMYAGPTYDDWKLATPPEYEDSYRGRPVGRGTPQRRTAFVLEFYEGGVWTEDPEGEVYDSQREAFAAEDARFGGPSRDRRISTVDVPA